MFRSICNQSFAFTRATSLIVSLAFFGCVSCDSSKKDAQKPPKWNQEQSTVLNKQLAAQEYIDIQLYVDRQAKLSFEETGSGLRQAFVYDSIGETAVSGQTAFVEFEIFLLDGTLAYATDDDELNRFKIDRSEVETGVQEAIKKMSVGDHCKIIIPSHLGHGLVGDLNKIPPLTPLIVDLKLIKLK